MATTTHGRDSRPPWPRCAWSPPAEPRDDMPWLVPWLHGKRTGTYLEVAPGETAAAIAARLRS